MTKQTLLLLFIIISIANQQRPCVDYIYDEFGCVSNKGYQCSWNEFLSACQVSSATDIGCNSVLNELACVAQVSYPNDDWAYCRFSGYCRFVTDKLSNCDPNLSLPACLSVQPAKCTWSDRCIIADETTVAASQNASTLTDQLKWSSIVVCQGIKNFAAIHAWGATTVAQKLYNQYAGNNQVLAQKYKDLLSIPGCLSPDAAMLSILTCSAGGLNQISCILITTAGQKCIFQQGSCKQISDPTQLFCSDLLNREGCLSVANIKEPCYWQNGRCLKYGMTASVACGTVKVNNVTVEVSPSFCAAITVANQECFYYEKKKRCHPMCRAATTVSNKTTCKQSSFGCVYQNNTCQFKNSKSQCGLSGQNKLACMNAAENCQFQNGLCVSLSDMSQVKCTDGLNKKACIMVTNKSQTCQYIGGECKFLKVNSETQCSIADVNPNACNRITNEECYYKNGECTVPTNPPCTAIGLNKVSCLKTKNTASPCQWSSNEGICKPITVKVNVTACDMKLVNDYACRSVLNTTTNVLCRWNVDTYSCETFTMSNDVKCADPGLNFTACVSVSDPAKSCRWLQGQCTNVGGSLGVGVSCSGLQGVTARTCAMVTADDEPCLFKSDGYRCSSSVPKASPCNVIGINPFGCAFLDAACYFDDNTKSCLAAGNAVYNTLKCTTGYTSKAACMKITTPGEKCRWNAQKKLCSVQLYPTFDGCGEIELVNKNSCLGYEQYQDSALSASSRCTSDAISTTCVLDTRTSLTGCGTSENVNLHTCVALSEDTQECYFDLLTFKCTLNSGTIANTIQCKQANRKLCMLVTTPGQACRLYNTGADVRCKKADAIATCDTTTANVNANYCESLNTAGALCGYDTSTKKCIAAPDAATDCSGLSKAACIVSTNQACYYNPTLLDCSIVTPAIGLTLKCDAAVNEKGCYAVLGGACVWDASACTEVTDFDGKTCTDFTTLTYSPTVCGSVIGAKCKYDPATNKCKIEVAAKGLCENGQSETNCLQQNSCDFNSEIKTCKSLTTTCAGTDKATCMAFTDPCTFDGIDCTPSWEGKCADYAEVDYFFNAKTCSNVVGEICNISTDGTFKCVLTPSVKCTTGIGRDPCKLIQNSCDFVSEKCIASTKLVKKCLDNFTRYSCTIDKAYFCQWNVDEGICQDFEGEPAECVEMPQYISTAVCFYQSYGSCYQNNQQECVVDSTTPTSCANAFTPVNCKNVPKNCWWNNTTYKCSELVDLTLAPKMTCFQFLYSNKQLCLMPTNEGELCYYDKSNFCIAPDVNTVKCTEDLNVGACEAIVTEGQLCHYTNKCGNAVVANIKCTDHINLYSCIAVSSEGQYCIWLGQKCVNFTSDGFTKSTYSLINQHVCRRAYTVGGQPFAGLAAVAVKYSEERSGCVDANPLTDLCNTPGLNYYGCLTTSAGKCTWNGFMCVIFVPQPNYSQCNHYIKVSPGVCEQIVTPGLKCQFSQSLFSCMDAQLNLQKCDQNYNQNACLQSNGSCKWVNSKCQTQDVIPGVTSCISGGAQNSLEKYSSYASCALVSYNNQVCRFDEQTQFCVSSFDDRIHTCSTKGLNQFGCASVKLQKCKFINGVCQVYKDDEQSCRNLQQVNSKVCQSLANLSQPCKFSKIQGGCTQVNSYDLCASPGLNQAGCGILAQCIWHPDELYCECRQSLYGQRFCAGSDQSTCKANPNCVWKDTSCGLKMCDYFSPTSCTGTIINNRTCYLTKSGTCASARTCDEVVNIADCNKIIVFGVTCAPLDDTTCKVSSCSDIINQSYCYGDCKWSGHYCYEMQCSYIAKSDECVGSYAKQACAWSLNACIGIDHCQQYMTLYTDLTDQQKKCDISQIKGRQCRWQQDKPYSKTFECSSNQCRPLGSSKANCHGAEVNGEVCVLQVDFSCSPCELITDKCTCANQIGYCYYDENKGCNSITCNSQNQEMCLSDTTKCQWNAKGNQCLVQCAKMKESQCTEISNSAQLCYWDSVLSRCQSGQAIPIVVDTVKPLLIEIIEFQQKVAIALITYVIMMI